MNNFEEELEVKDENQELQKQPVRRGRPRKRTDKLIAHRQNKEDAKLAEQEQEAEQEAEKQAEQAVLDAKQIEHDRLNNLTLAELKVICKENGYKSSGTKKHLICFIKNKISKQLPYFSAEARALREGKPKVER